MRGKNQRSGFTGLQQRKEISMEKTGTLQYRNGHSFLDETLLAISEPNPLGAATNYLRGKGLHHGDLIRVTGDEGSIGDYPVIFLASADRVPRLGAREPVVLRAQQPNKGATRKKTARASAGRKNVKRTSKKQSTKKTR